MAVNRPNNDFSQQIAQIQGQLASGNLPAGVTREELQVRLQQFQSLQNQRDNMVAGGTNQPVNPRITTSSPRLANANAKLDSLPGLITSTSSAGPETMTPIYEQAIGVTQDVQNEATAAKNEDETGSQITYAKAVMLESQYEDAYYTALHQFQNDKDFEGKEQKNARPAT